MSLLRIFSAFAFFAVASIALPTPSFAADEDDYSPIESSNVSEQAIVSQKISRDLDRPIQVGVFVSVPNIFVRQKGEEIHITASRGKLKIKTKGKRQQTTDRRVFKAVDGCIAIATDKASLNKACYEGEFIITANGNKLNAINVIDMEEYILQKQHCLPSPVSK